MPMASLTGFALKAMSLSCLLSLDGSLRACWALSALGRSPRGPRSLKLAPLVHMPPRAPLQPFFVQSTFSREIPRGWGHPGHPVVGRGGLRVGNEPAGRSCVECNPGPYLSLPHPPAGSLPLTCSFPSLPSSRMSLSSALFPAQSSPHSHHTDFNSEVNF